MTISFRQLDRGTYCLHSVSATDRSSSDTRRLMRSHADDPTLVGYAMTHMMGGKLVETWVLFGHFRSPQLDKDGNSTGFEIHAVSPEKIVAGFKADKPGDLPSLKAFVEGALAGRTDRERCTVMQSSIKILDKDRLPHG